jgi:tetratricopeptide (TPR) repeat protein
MSDPLRTDAARSADSLADTNKEARIEQLLLSGLDEYFAGQYEQAINIWTRVVFLERGHSRARAYIERARGALAERHRESEELLQRGIAAFNDGETENARELITRAVEQGGPHDVALVLLERLNRLATPAGTPDASRPAQPARRTPAPLPAVVAGRHSWRVAAAAALAIVMGGAAVGVMSGVPMPIWLTDPAGVPQEQVAAMPPDPLPIARSSERLVARARAFQAGGHLHDALRSLEGIDFADPMRPEADRLRAELQRQLLDAAVTEAAR